MDPAKIQARLIDALLDPRRFPSSVARVERIETHISTVLLAGEFAYKIKKPVNLGFVDFSTLKRRGFFCAEEVRLNRRLAPDLYLGRVTITGTPADPRLDAPGEAIEYAVRMRRFPQHALLSRQLAGSGLPLPLMDRLAGQLAAFHAGADVAPADSDFGLPARVALPVRDSLRDLKGLAAPTDQVRLEEARIWVEAALAVLAPLFQTRRRDGCVRECHGDLHLGNMALWDDRLLLFDGIEFDPSLRWTDVMNDLAFALMDLDYRQAAVHGRRLKSAYLELGGDYAGLGVLRFYQLYRALVRAKIAGLRARQLSAGTAERTAQETEIAAHLNLAGSYTLPRRPRLVITCGLAGSGKSTLAQALVDTCGFVRIRSDVERKRLFGLAPGARSGAGLAQGMYAPEAGERTYARLAALAALALEAGEPVVVDAAFLRRAQREPFRALAAAKSLPLELLWIDAPPEVLQARVSERLVQGVDASEAGPAVLAYQREQVEWPQAEEGRLVRLASDREDWPERLRQAFG